MECIAGIVVLALALSTIAFPFVEDWLCDRRAKKYQKW